MSFCSRCGGRLEGAPPTVCPTCGQRVWRNAKPGAAALVVRDGRLLLVRRALTPWRGAWCAPSGFCDGDEHPILTAERETLEETGFAVRVTGFLGIWAGPYEDGEATAVAYYHAELAGVIPHSDELMTLASAGIFACRYPEHAVTATYKRVAARLIEGAGSGQP